MVGIGITIFPVVVVDSVRIGLALTVLKLRRAKTRRTKPKAKGRSVIANAKAKVHIRDGGVSDGSPEKGRVSFIKRAIFAEIAEVWGVAAIGRAVSQKVCVYFIWHFFIRAISGMP